MTLPGTSPPKCESILRDGEFTDAKPLHEPKASESGSKAQDKIYKLSSSSR